MSKPRPFYNASCIKCDAIEKIMMRIGAVIMCSKCSEETFKTEDPVMDEREVYLDYLEKSIKKALEED